MLNAFMRLTLVTILTFVFTVSGFAQDNRDHYPISDVLKIQTVVFQTELYREYKIVIEDALSREEQRIAKEAKDWHTDQWHGFVDKLIDQKIILAIDEDDIPKEKVPLMKKLKVKLVSAMKSVIHSLVAMGRKDGPGTVIAYLGGSAAGYGMVGVGALIGSAGMVSFFSIFPLATVTVSAVLAVKSISDNIKLKKAFNDGEDFDYFSEYKTISKKVKKHLNLKKGDMIYAFNDQNGVVIRKKGIIPGILSFFGFNRDKLSLRYLKRALKKEDLYTEDLKAIKKNRDLGYVEKVVTMIQYIEKNFEQKEKDLILGHFTKQRVYDLPLVQNMTDIAMWGIDSTKIESLQRLPYILEMAPKNTSYITIVKVYQDFIIPRLADNIRGKIKFKMFKCLRQGYYEQLAMGFKNIRLEWLPESKASQMMIGQIEACLAND